MTHEDKKRAVLAECERLTKDGTFEITPQIWLGSDPEAYSICRMSSKIHGVELCRVVKAGVNTTVYIEIAYRLLGLNQPPAQKVDFSPIAEDLKIVHNAMVKAYADNEFNVSELFALNAVETYLTKLEMGLVQPPADTKWERLKEKIESSRVWLEKQDKSMGDWNDIDNHIKVFTKLITSVEEEGEPK